MWCSYRWKESVFGDDGVMNNKQYYDDLAIETCELFLSKEIDLEELGSRIKDFVGDYRLTEDIKNAHMGG